VLGVTVLDKIELHAALSACIEVQSIRPFFVQVDVLTVIECDKAKFSSLLATATSCAKFDSQG